MDGSFLKTSGAAMLYSLTLPHFFSVTSSVVIIIYFISMLKLNVVDKKYMGSWRLFIKSVLKRKRK